MYGPGSSFIALKHKHVSSTSTGPPTCTVDQRDVEARWGKCNVTHDISSTSAFIRRYVLESALYLDQIEGLALQLDASVSQDGFDLGQLILVARDEIEFSRGHLELSNRCAVINWSSERDVQWMWLYAGVSAEVFLSLSALDAAYYHLTVTASSTGSLVCSSRVPVTLQHKPVRI